MATYPRGIDVSNNNGAIDWGQVAASGVQFAIAKVSEGLYFRDGWFAENFAACKTYNLGRGCYHYGVPSESGPEDEARYFLDAIGLLYGELETGDVLALDLEDPAAWGDLSEWTLRWVQYVEQAVGYKPMVYTSPSYANAHGLYNQPALGHYGLWLASWGVPTPPPAPAPWRLVAIHQIGVAPAGTQPGVAGQCDTDRFNGSSVEQFKLYGKPDGPPPAGEQPPVTEGPPADDLPVYVPGEPAQAQDWDFDCSQQSASWMLWSYGRTPDDDWMEQSLISEGVMTAEWGLMDASGAGLADWLNRHYGPGYVASNDGDVSFDDIAAEAATMKHPTMIGGRAWGAGGHWSGCRGYSAADDLLLLANPANGYDEIYQTMSRAQFAGAGPFSLVRLTYPAAETDAPPSQPEPEPEPPLIDYSQTIGSGLLSMMAEDGAGPAQAGSVTYGQPWQVEQAYGDNGVLYVWLLNVGRGYRLRPS